MTRLWTVPVAMLFAAGVAAAQTPAPSAPQSTSLAEGLKRSWASAKRNVMESADKAPDGIYSFKPTPEVRSFGELLGHITDGNVAYCSYIKGEAPPNSDAEKITAKADLIKALNESFAMCDAAINAMTDEKLLEKVTNAGRGETARGVWVSTAIAHANEHYGNLVTYLRLKNIVPPSTERAQKAAAAAPKKTSQN
jgi:uncharacterized damage-inducible protein DinB